MFPALISEASSRKGGVIIHTLSPEAKAESQRGVLGALVSERAKAIDAEASERGLPTPRYDGGFFVSVYFQDPHVVAARMRGEGGFLVPIEGGVRLLCAVPASEVPRWAAAAERAL